jgi:hypothetical protein
VHIAAAARPAQHHSRLAYMIVRTGFDNMALVASRWIGCFVTQHRMSNVSHCT